MLTLLEEARQEKNEALQNYNQALAALSLWKKENGSKKEFGLDPSYKVLKGEVDQHHEMLLSARNLYQTLTRLNPSTNPQSNSLSQSLTNPLIQSSESSAAVMPSNDKTNPQSNSLSQSLTNPLIQSSESSAAVMPPNDKKISPPFGPPNFSSLFQGFSSSRNRIPRRYTPLTDDEEVRAPYLKVSIKLIILAVLLVSLVINILNMLLESILSGIFFLPLNLLGFYAIFQDATTTALTFYGWGIFIGGVAELVVDIFWIFARISDRSSIGIVILTIIAMFFKGCLVIGYLYCVNKYYNALTRGLEDNESLLDNSQQV
jgi:hypothetical protein